MSKGTIVILCTQGTKLNNGHPTGAWGEEIAAPYYAFKDAGYKTVIASPNGGEIPLDKVSLEGDALTPETKKWLDDSEAQKDLKNSIPISKIDINSTVALFAAGGHGAVVDFPENPEVAKLVTDLYTKGKVISSVCHGAEIFKSAKDKDGNPIAKGKKITGFSDSEEKGVGLDSVPGLQAPEAILRGLGANYSKASSDWGSHTETDTSGTAPIVTGQNPASSEATAKAVLKVLAA